MKPIKDLAEHLANDPRVNQRALERFNYNLESIRCQIASGMDQLNVLTTKLTPEQYSFLSKFVFNLDRTFNALDECAIVPTKPDYIERRAAVENILDKYALTEVNQPEGGVSNFTIGQRIEFDSIEEANEFANEGLKRLDPDTLKKALDADILGVGKRV